MREKKFTPGPWVNGWGDGLTGPTTVSCTGPVCGEEWGYAVVSKGEETLAIAPAQVSFTGSPQNTEVMEANANLIAAAPELLEALEEMVGYVDSPHNPFSTSILGRAKSIISKAYGE